MTGNILAGTQISVWPDMVSTPRHEPPGDDRRRVGPDDAMRVGTAGFSLTRFPSGDTGGMLIRIEEAVPPEVLGSAADLGVLVGRVGLTDPKDNPVCASVRPPLIEWSAATE